MLLTIQALNSSNSNNPIEKTITLEPHKQNFMYFRKVDHQNFETLSLGNVLSGVWNCLAEIMMLL